MRTRWIAALGSLAVALGIALSISPVGAQMRDALPHHLDAMRDALPHHLGALHPGQAHHRFAGDAAPPAHAGYDVLPVYNADDEAPAR